MFIIRLKYILQANSAPTSLNRFTVNTLAYKHCLTLTKTEERCVLALLCSVKPHNASLKMLKMSDVKIVPFKNVFKHMFKKTY